jgi:hypothetical protein
VSLNWVLFDSVPEPRRVSIALAHRCGKSSSVKTTLCQKKDMSLWIIFFEIILTNDKGASSLALVELGPA